MISSITINREKLLSEMQNEIATILDISIFEVEEISDIDLQMIESSIESIIRNYSHSFAHRQKENQQKYNMLKDNIYKELFNKEKEK